MTTLRHLQRYYDSPGSRSDPVKCRCREYPFAPLFYNKNLSKWEILLLNANAASSSFRSQIGSDRHRHRHGSWGKWEPPRTQIFGTRSLRCVDLATATPTATATSASTAPAPIEMISLSCQILTSGCHLGCQTFWFRLPWQWKIDKFSHFFSCSFRTSRFCYISFKKFNDYILFVLLMKFHKF